MTIEFSLNENDYLQHQLFIASKNERIKKKRNKSWIIASLIILCFVILFYKNGNRVMTYGFVVFLIYTICFYPLYLRSHYKNHYKKFIAEAYKNKVGIKSIIKFTDSHIEMCDRSGESRINLSELYEINEIGEYIYLRMKMGESLIIPKYKINNIDVLRNYLLELAQKLNIKWIPELNWKWK